MKKTISIILFVITLFLSLSGCNPRTSPTATVEASPTDLLVPTRSGTSDPVVLQAGNDLPKLQLQPKPSSQLEDNRIGSLWDGFWPMDMNAIIDNEILPTGLKRVRLAINGISFDTIHWEKAEFSIEPKNDDIISRIADNNIKITYVLTFWDTESWPKGEGANCPRFKTEEEIQRYLDYVRFTVYHFKDRVQYYEIWNEPDMGWDEENIEPCIEAIEVDDYINLTRRAIPVIREEYPEAKIVVGSTMNQVEPGSREYLLSILISDIMPLVDVVAWHPGGGPSPEYDYWREYYEIYPSLVQEIIDVSTANGFQGEFSADEMVWWAEEDVPPWEPWTYSNQKAAKYYARFIIMHLGMDVTVQPGGISESRLLPLFTIQNLCTLMAGAEPANLSIEIRSDAENMMSYGFSFPNGDKMVALWTHGAAVNDDPGIEVVLTFLDLPAGEVTGFDVLLGFEQQIMTETEDGNLVVRDLLVKDYPLILRVTEASSP